jgi:hypothetical protein
MVSFVDPEFFYKSLQFSVLKPDSSVRDIFHDSFNTSVPSFSPIKTRHVILKKNRL